MGLRQGGRAPLSAGDESRLKRPPADPLGWISLLADEAGPRRPTGAGERRGTELLRAALAEAGVTAELQPFNGYPTFAEPYGAITAIALAPELLPAGGDGRLSGLRRAVRSVLAVGALAALSLEGGLVHTPISDALRRRPSANLVARLEPASGTADRTICLMCHLDTSRSGLMFHPRFTPHLNRWLLAVSVATALQATEPLLGGGRRGRRLLAAARAVLAANAALLAERELRGEDVAGANDNASGAAVVATLAAGLAARPLERTRVVVLMTGCEESGTLGAQSFLRSTDTDGWLFLNFDNVGGPGRLHYLPEEGIAQRRPADPELIRLAESVGAEHPELGLAAAERPIGLTYDATPVLARGGRALTFVAAGPGGVIPNYHWPSDVIENVDPDAVARAVTLGRELVSRIDRSG